jgi:hypothetical protein
MDTYTWGPALWTALHSITFNYPDYPTAQDKYNHAVFFHSLKNILPCETCQKHFRQGIEQSMPVEPALESRDKLTRWLVDFHNKVNQRIGKPVVSYESVRDKYEAMRGKCQLPAACNVTARKKTDNLLYLVIFLLLFVIMLVLFYLSRSKRRE